MIKVLQIAVREFLATVLTKGFILGVMMTPVMLGIVIVAMPLLLNRKPPKIDGEVAIADSTGEVVPGLQDYLTQEAIAERRDRTKIKISEGTPEPLRELTENSPEAQEALEAALGEIPTIRVTALPKSADLEAEKSLLHEGSTADGGRLALVVLHENAVQPSAPDEAFGTYDLYIREKLDDRIVDEVRGGMRRSIVDARVRAAGLDRERIEALTRVGRVRSTMVSKGGESQIDAELQLFIPMGFMILLLVSVFTGGQYLMTTTIEEKSSRVVEVLLSAVSPMQLMTGKIIGQMCVGLLIIGLYAGMGISALFSFALMGLLDISIFFYLVIFYLIAYFVVGSFMAAIGAAVNEPREAQSFMMPIMVVMMIPWILWMPITRDPNSMFATISSFVPPINTFVMLLRMTSTTPPPMWQVWVSILVGLASVYAALWFAAKVFRVGLLLHGKPPSFATLIKWVRMA
jgi:ABC-2 type transport system permease protein